MCLVRGVQSTAVPDGGVTSGVVGISLPKQPVKVKTRDKISKEMISFL
jgi:hypothetical protein